MADRTTAFATQSVNLTCSVASRSEFTLYWFKGREKLGGPLFYPLVSYFYFKTIISL